MMHSSEQKKFVEKVDEAIRKANSWDNIDKFFNENKQIQKVYEEVRRECYKDQCFGASTIYIEVINKLMEMAEVEWPEEG